MSDKQTSPRKESPEKHIDRMEFQPNGDGTFSPVEIPKLSRSERREVREALTMALQSLDVDFDGRLSASEGRDIAASRKGFEAVVGPAIDAVNQHNLASANMPWLQRNPSIVVDDQLLFDRDTLKQRLLRQPDIAALGESELERIMSSALPAGVAGIRVSDECALDPQLRCAPIGQRLLVTNRDTSGPTY